MYPGLPQNCCSAAQSCQTPWRRKIAIQDFVHNLTAFVHVNKKAKGDGGAQDN